MPRSTRSETRTKVVVTAMLVVSSLFMSLAWIGHLKFSDLHFAKAFFLCWLLVLPEYALNVGAIRLGYGALTGAQMASIRLCSGVVCVALVAHFWLGEELGARQVIGFGVMVCAMLLVTYPGGRDEPTADGEPDSNRVAP